jgi:hypothetical protein
VIRLCAGWSGVGTPVGQEIFSFPSRPDQLLGPPNLLFDG